MKGSSCGLRYHDKKQFAEKTYVSVLYFSFVINGLKFCVRKSAKTLLHVHIRKTNDIYNFYFFLYNVTSVLLF